MSGGPVSAVLAWTAANADAFAARRLSPIGASIRMHDAVQASRPRGRDLGTVRSSCMVDDGARYFLISSIRNGLNGRQMMRFRRSHRSSSSAG